LHKILYGLIFSNIRTCKEKLD